MWRSQTSIINGDKSRAEREGDVRLFYKGLDIPAEISVLHNNYRRTVFRTLWQSFVILYTDKAVMLIYM